MQPPSPDSVEKKGMIVQVYDTVITSGQNIYLNIRKNIILFLLCIMLSIGVFVGKALVKPVLYQASFTVIYEELVRKIYGDSINKLNALITQKNHDKVSKLLGIKRASAESIHEIYGQNILGEDLTLDLSTDKIPFVVVVVSKDSSTFNEIQDGIVSFLGTGSPYLASKSTIRSQEVASELEYLNRQISYIDSIEKRMGSGDRSVSATSEVGGKSIYEFSYELYKKKQELERKKVMPDNLQVIDDIIVPVKVKPFYKKMIAVGAIVGVLIYAILMLFILPVVRMRRVYVNN